LLSNVKFAKYFDKNKIGKINIVLKSPENQSNTQKLLLDKQIRFKEFCVSWNKFHKNLPRDSFKIFLEKNVVLCEIFSKKSKLTEYLCPCTVYRGGQLFESRSGRGVQHYVIKFISDLRQVGGFLRVLQFPPPLKLTATIYSAWT
jgi:hypothetical protein